VATNEPRTIPVEILGSNIPMLPPVRAPTATRKDAITPNNLYRGSEVPNRRKSQGKRKVLTKVKVDIARKECSSEKQASNEVHLP
jgi:hypothetical protein